MGWIGMVGAGFGFLMIGLWQGFLIISSYLKSRSSPHLPPPLKQRVTTSTAQLSIIAFLSLLHIVSGLVASHNERKMADGVGFAVPLERSGVGIAFFVYAITALICERTTFLPLPWEVVHLMATVAFGQEFLLFYLQREDSGLESRYYGLLLVPIGACVVSMLLEIAYPLSVLLPLVRSMALVLQGTWLFQMAVSFFSSGLIAKGCELKMKGEGDYTVVCNGMALMRGKAVATLQFNCHMAFLLVSLLPLYSIISRKYNVDSNQEILNYERLGNGDMLELDRSVRELSGRPSPFSLELEEDDEFNGNVFQSLSA